QLERALMRSQETGKAMRQRSFAGIAGARNAEWLEAEAAGAWAVWEQGMIERARQGKMIEVDAAKSAYLERRKERRQAASVIDAGTAVDTIEGSRREQRELDDWFGQRSRPGRRRGQ